MDIHTDCLVVGGGPAGYGAAYAAASMGADTVIAERHGFLGGMGAAAGLNSFINHHYQNRIDLSDGVYRRLVRAMFQANGMYRFNGPNADFFDIEALKRVLELTLLSEGVRVYYHCAFDHIVEDKDGYRVRLLGKGDEVLVTAKYVIDATGDADVCAKAGVPVSYGKDGSRHLAQPMSMVVQLAGFDSSEYAAAGFRVDEQGRACQAACWREEIQLAKEAGEWSIPRDCIAMWWSAPRDSAHIFINGTRIQGMLGCDPEQLSSAETEGRRQAGELAAFFRKYVPGFRRSYLLSTGPQIGVRETRRIVGEYSLTKDDVLSGFHAEDTVVECAYPIDIHAALGDETKLYNKGDTRYGIPYRCLWDRRFKHLIAAGRCISAEHEAAGSFRVMPTCMSLGEAAGTAVGLCHEKALGLQEVSGAEVREKMDARRGQPLTDPDSGIFNDYG